jgi:hypothetical protein
LFKPVSRLNPADLPTFDHLAPDSTVGLIEMMRDAKEMSQALAALRAAGLIGDDT